MGIGMGMGMRMGMKMGWDEDEMGMGWGWGWDDRWALWLNQVSTPGSQGAVAHGSLLLLPGEQGIAWEDL